MFPDISEEKIYVCLEECEKSGVRFDLIPKPTKIWSADFDFTTLKELPEKGVRKDKIYKVEDPDKADTFVYIVTPENLNLLTPTHVILRCVESVLGSKGFVFIGFVNLKDNPEINEFKDLLIEYEKEYSGIKFRDFENEPNEEDLLCWMKGE